MALVLILLLLRSGSVLGQPLSGRELGVRSFAIDEPGHLSYLGVDIEVTPDLRLPVRRTNIAEVVGFWIKLTYDDPIKNDKAVTFLDPSLFPADCPSPGYLDPGQPYLWSNSRGTSFAVTFEQHCKEVDSGKAIPYIEFQIWSSDPETEEKYLKVVREKKVFDILPTGFVVRDRNETYETLEILQVGYKLVSTVVLVLDVVTFFKGVNVSAGKFAFRLIVGHGVDYAVDQGFDYLKEEYGYSVRFSHTGWDIRCRLCGETFHRKNLLEGELLTCPRHDCDGEAYLHF